MITVTKINKNQWREYFTSLYKTDNTPDREIGLQDNDQRTTVTKEEIESTIKTLKNGEPAEDGITNELIKYGKQELVDELRKLFQKILNCGIVLTEWKTSITIPLFKKSKKDDPKNYRGIALLNTVSKLLTKIIALKIGPMLDMSSAKSD